MNLKLISLGACVCALLGMGCHRAESTADIPAVTKFDAARYMGRWYEIARLPHWFESNVVDATAYYSLLPDGRFQVVNSGIRDGERRSMTGYAKSLFGNDIGEFEVRFHWPVRGLYKIIYVDPDYQAAIVTSGTMDYVWILARSPMIPPQQLGKYLEMLKKWGFAVKLLQYPSGEVCEIAK